MSVWVVDYLFGIATGLAIATVIGRKRQTLTHSQRKILVGLTVPGVLLGLVMFFVVS